jgi:hypothetical protein
MVRRLGAVNKVTSELVSKVTSEYVGRVIS